MLERGKSAGWNRDFIGLLDIGTSKIACVIAARDPKANALGARIVGIGHQRSRGVKAGVVTDLDEAEIAVRAAVSQAEHIAGVTLDQVLVSVSCGRLKSMNFTANAEVADRIVSDEDIARVMTGGQAYAERDGRSLLHMNRIGFRLDGVPGGFDPRGMVAARLSADLHAVTADEAPIRNLMLVVERCYLSVGGLIAAPYASALSVTSEEERNLGVTCVDIGAGTATISSFVEGQFMFAEAVPVGGQHITFDIARALQTPLAEAERIKALYGTVLSAQSDGHEAFSYPLAGEEEGALYQTTKAKLAEIIRPRVASILTLVRERLDRSGATRLAGEKIVLTGGSTQLVGMGAFAANVLARPVRIGRPERLSGAPERLSSPGFATASGLLVAALAGGAQMMTSGSIGSAEPGYIGRVGRWLKSGF